MSRASLYYIASMAVVTAALLMVRVLLAPHAGGFIG